MAQSTPLPFLIIQKAFPILEKIAPKLAGKLGYYLFFRPIPTPLRQEEKSILQKAERFSLHLDSRTIQGYSWKNPKATKTAVFMHGWSGNAGQPNHLIERLSEQGFNVFAFDGPGHGSSEGNRTHVFEFKDLLLQLQKKVGVFDVLVGHSFGSIASCNAMSYGLDVHQYVSLSAPVIASDILNEFSKIVNCSGQTTKIMEQMVYDEINREFETVSIEYIASKLPKIPMLLMHDVNDKRVGCFNSERMHELLPHSTFIKTEGLGHNRIMNDTDVVNKIVEFIKLEELQLPRTNK